MATASRRKGAVVGLAVVLILGMVTIYVAWWSRPSTFGGHGDGLSGTISLADDDPAMIFDVTSGSAEVVTIHDVEPRIVTNTANADFEFVHCTYRSDATARIGAGPASDAAESCTKISAAVGRHFDPTSDIPAMQGLMLKVSPRTTGRVVLDGVDVTYRRGWRHLFQTGTEQTWVELSLEVVE